MASIIDKNGNIAFYGRLSWGNFFDWLVTFCLGAILILTTVFLGGVRPDTHRVLLPLFALLLILHGLWLALSRESPRRLSQVPLFFIPGLLWMFCSVLWWSPVPWRGWHELIYALEIFIFLWVLANNVRSRPQLLLLIIMSLVPCAVALFSGFYQFFQDSGYMLGAITDYDLAIHPEFSGRATGVFADPNTFAAFLLILLPSLLIVAAVPRLSLILRILAFYIALMFLGAISFTQSYWASVLGVLLLALVPWFCFRTFKRRALFSLLGVLAVSVVLALMVIYHPLFKKGFQVALSTEGEGVRLVLWQEALAIAADHPLTGVGAGAYGVTFEQSPRVFLADAPVTPHNDYLLLLSQLGLIGAVLLGGPMLYVFYKAWGHRRMESDETKPHDSKGRIMTQRSFNLALALAALIAFAVCMSVTFVFYVPALALYGVLAFSIFVKNSFTRRIHLPDHWYLHWGYTLLTVCAACFFYITGAAKLEAQALELRARQELEHVVDLRVHLSGNTALLDEVIQLFERAISADAANADAWLGLSASVCQLYFGNPSDFEAIGARAVVAAERGIELSPLYWKAWAQAGVAQSFAGNADAAEAALTQALKLAPHNSNAHYYYAAYLGADKDRRMEALDAVRIALEINPRNAAARRLQQKLLIP